MIDAADPAAIVGTAFAVFVYALYTHFAHFRPLHKQANDITEAVNQRPRPADPTLYEMTRENNQSLATIKNDMAAQDGALAQIRRDVQNVANRVDALETRLDPPAADDPGHPTGPPPPPPAE